jgi:signal recognition particle subunit SEC65
MDSETKAQRSSGRKLRHRAATLRKMAEELDAIAAEIEASATVPSEQADKTDGEVAA